MPTKTSSISEAARLILAGELVAFPTETVYGLGANALDAAAVDRIFAVKGRPATSPLIVHVDSIDMARTLVAEWPEKANRLAERFWPGPLTLVLPKLAHVPDCVTAGLSTVAIRMPSHPLALALIRECGVPLAGPSANRFTELSPTTAEHVRSSLNGEVAMILDGGPTEVGIESTVLSLVAPEPILLRPGMISRTDLEAVIGTVRLQAIADEGGAHPSPGMHRKHYSPRTPLVMELPATGRGAYLFIHGAGTGARPIQMPADPAAYAAKLYAVLHELDREGLDWIAVEPPPDGPDWEGIGDRLRRAASE